MLSDKQAGVLFLVSFIGAIVAWRRITVKFLQEHGKPTTNGFRYVLLDLAWDVWRAVSIRIRTGARLPAGVYLHGVLVLLSYALLFTPFLWDAHS